jgi:hypothetical protein
LRYGDGVQKSSIPVIAGAAAAIVAAPIVAILPIVGAPAALALGAGVGLGTRACVHDIDGKLTPDPARPAGPAAFARARARRAWVRLRAHPQRSARHPYFVPGPFALNVPNSA